MRLFAMLFLIVTVSTEAKRRRTGKQRPKITEERNLQGQLQYKSSDDPNEEKYRYPVPFGHIFKEGFEDPRSDFKRPMDPLELGTVYVKDGPYAREFIKNHPTKYQVVQRIETSKKLIPPQNVPQDIPHDFSGSNTNVQRGYEQLGNSNKNDSIRPYWNMEGILLRNLQEPLKYRIGGGQMPKRKQADNGPSFQGKGDYFGKQTYDLISELEKPRNLFNFTTCDEFAKRAKFHPDDIVNIDWVPFYIWTYEVMGRVGVSLVHQFSFPTKKFVKSFKEDYSSLLDKTLDWEQPKLIMKQGSTEFLLVAVGRSGLFDGVAYQNLPTKMKSYPGFLKIPTVAVQMKIVDPYLALMYCDQQYAVIMAISGSEPKSPRQCISEAATLKLIGKGFPVQRDLYTEAMEARAKTAEVLLKEQNKFITLEDQMEAERPLFTL